MNKAELLAAIEPKLPKAAVLVEGATNAELEELLGVLNAGDELEKAQEDLGAAKEALATKQAQLEGLETDVLELNEKLGTASALAGDIKTVKVDGATYKVCSGANTQFGKFTKEEIAENKPVEEGSAIGIADYLVEVGAGTILQEVTNN